jgi:hypothetical protein
MSPTFRYVGTPGALADGVNVVLFNEMRDLEVILVRGKFDFEPSWLFFGV